MTTIEKAVAAAYIAYCGAMTIEWESDPEGQLEKCIRAALQAIREIDPDIMLRVQWGRVPDRIQAYWGDTITAILSESA